MKTVYLWWVNEREVWAGTDRKSVLVAYQKANDLADSDFWLNDEDRVLPEMILPEEYSYTVFDGTRSVTFQDKLDSMIQEGTVFPCPFSIMYE